MFYTAGVSSDDLKWLGSYTVDETGVGANKILNLSGGSIKYTDSPTVTALTITGLTGVLKATTGLVSGSAVHGDLGGIGAGDHHAVVSLAVSADVLLGLTGQALSLDTQAATYVLVGPTSGAAAAPTFRALVVGDMPTINVAHGGTGQTALTAYGVLCAGTTTTGVVQTVVPGATTQILVGGGATGIPTWGADLPTAVTIGSGYIYRAAGTDIPVTDGGTGVSTLTDGGILLGSGASAITALGQATHGQLPIGSTGGDPVLATLTAGTGIGVSNAAGSITISCSITQYTDALARAAISETVTGLSYDNNSGVLSLTSGYVIPTTTEESNWNAAYGLSAATSEPTGFVDRVAALSWSDATLEFTITGNHDIYIAGVKTTKTTVSKTIADTTGLHWIYYNTSGVISESTIQPGFAVPLIATVYWNTTTDKGLLADERHGIVMDWATHELLHETVGARWNTGLAGTFGNTTFSIAVGEMDDEDLQFVFAAPMTTCSVLYKNGSAEFTWDAAATLYYHLNVAAIQYNNANTTTDATNNFHVAYWIFATGDVTRPIVSLMGQREDRLLADARTNNKYESLTLGTLPYAEMKLLYRVILKNASGTATFVEAQDLRSVSNLPAGTYLASQHNALTGLEWSLAGHNDINFNVNHNADGRVGIGTFSPSAALHAAGSTTEMLLNGDFHDTNDWTATFTGGAATGVFDVVTNAGKATLTEGNVNVTAGYISQAITTVADHRYRATITYYGTLSSNIVYVYLAAGTALNGNQLGYSSITYDLTTDNIMVFDFVATGTTTYVTAYTTSLNSVVGVSVWDDASVVDVTSGKTIVDGGMHINPGAGVTNLNYALCIGKYETTTLTSNKDKTLLLCGMGAAYFLARDTLNNIEGFFGTTGGGYALATMTDHPLFFRTHNHAAMAIDLDQNIGIGLTTGMLGKLHIDQSSTSGAVPPMVLDQADVSEEFIRFIGTSANGVLTQSIVEAADVATATLKGYVKVYVQDDGNQLTDQAYYQPIYTLA
jgi:hypothetical protein